MNDFKLMSESYRMLSEEGKISQEEAEKKCKAYDYLASCDDEDIYNLFDSSAFNEIARAYMRLAVKELISEGQLDEDQGRAVRNRFSLLFDEKQSKEVCSKQNTLPLYDLSSSMLSLLSSFTDCIESFTVLKALFAK